MNDNRLKEIREENGLTLKELSKLVGLASNTLSQYENKNREPTLEIWKRLANFFNVTPQYLVGWSDEK